MARLLNNSTCCGLSEIDSLQGVTAEELTVLVGSARTMVIATVNQHQGKAKKVLTNFGFKTLKRFRNRNTNNYVYLMGYDKSARR